MSLPITGVVNSDDIRKFWPAILDLYDPDILDDQIDFYISRAEILINAMGPYNIASPGYSTIMPMAFKLLVRRLVQYDEHPASSAEPAGVNAESVRGVSYTKKTGYSLDDLLGFEVKSILTDILPADGNGIDFSVQISDVVFYRPAIQVDTNGGTQFYFEPSIDDDIRNEINRRLGYSLQFGIGVHGPVNQWFQQ